MELITQETVDRWNEEWPEPAGGLEDPGGEPDAVNGAREIGRVTDEELQAVLREHGRVAEPEIARERAKKDASGQVGVDSYIDDHPTHWDWLAPVARAVNRVQGKLPYQTWAGSYVWHPPYDPPNITIRYDALSADLWGGGLWNGKYAGYRGKPIGFEVGQEAFRALWRDPYGPLIHWIIWNNGMWIRGRGWSAAPWGPPDSDAAHVKHVHCTFVRP